MFRPPRAPPLPHLDSDLFQWPETTAELMQQLVSTHRIPLNQQMRLLTRLRLAKSFADHQLRIQCVLVRLQAISVLGRKERLIACTLFRLVGDHLSLFLLSLPPLF